MSETTPHHERQNHFEHHHHVDLDSELLLEDMGCKSQLQRGLNILGNLAKRHGPSSARGGAAEDLPLTGTHPR